MMRYSMWMIRLTDILRLNNHFIFISRYTFLTRLCKYIHGIFFFFLRGYLNVESRLVLKRILPETSDAGTVCKRRKTNLRKGRKP